MVWSSFGPFTMATTNVVKLWSASFSAGSTACVSIEPTNVTDFMIRGCGGEIFSDGFESGNTSVWDVVVR